MNINLEDSYALTGVYTGVYGKSCVSNTHLFLSTNDTIKAFSIDPLDLITSIDIISPLLRASQGTFSGIYWDGTYLYHQNSNPILVGLGLVYYILFQAYTFNGSSFNLEYEDSIVGYCVPPYGGGITGDGTHIFRAYINIMWSVSGIEAFKWDSGSIVSDGFSTAVGMTPYTIRMMHYQNGYIFSSTSDMLGLEKIRYSSPNFTIEKSISSSIKYLDVHGDGTYIYAARLDENIIDAYDEDLNLIDSFTAYPTTGTTFKAISVRCIGNYIVASFFDNGTKILSFNGSTFSEEATIAEGQLTFTAAGIGRNIFIANLDSGIEKYSILIPEASSSSSSWDPQYPSSSSISSSSSSIPSIEVDFDYAFEFSFGPPFCVKFNDLTSHDRPIVSWAWIFGDGESSTFKNPIHYYEVEKVYTVSLTVVDDQGATGTTTKQITISVPTIAPAVIPRIVDKANKRITVEVSSYNYVDKVKLDNGIISGTLNLVYLGDIGNETIIGTSSFDRNVLTEEGSVNLKFLNVSYLENLFVDFNILTDAGTFTGRINVLVIEEHSKKTGVSIPLQNADEIDKKIVPLQEYVINPELNNSIQVDFTSENNTVYTGNGTLQYAGGGNRFLQNSDNTMTLQKLNENPVESGLEARCDLKTSNLIDNNDFIKLDGIYFPEGYSLTCTEDISISPLYSNSESIPNTKKLSVSVCGASTFNSPITFSTPIVPISSITDFQFSSYLGVTPSGNSDLMGIIFRMVFFDENDIEVYSVEKEYDPSIFIWRYVIKNVKEVSTNIPLTSKKVKGEIVFNWFSIGDLFVLNFGVPQLTTVPVETSLILNTDERKADIYTITGQNIDYRSGIIEVQYNSIVVGINSTIIDTTLYSKNGLILQVLSDGKITLTFIDTLGVSSTIQTEEIDFSAFTERLIRIEWKSLNSVFERSIYLNDTLYVSSTEEFQPPSENNNTIFVGSNIDGENQICGELIFLKIIT